LRSADPDSQKPLEENQTQSAEHQEGGRPPCPFRRLRGDSGAADGLDFGIDYR